MQTFSKSTLGLQTANFKFVKKAFKHLRQKEEYSFRTKVAGKFTNVECW